MAKASGRLASPAATSSSPRSCTCHSTSRISRHTALEANRTAHTRRWNTYHDKVEQCLDESLASLGVDYLDLYLIHWPVRLVPNESSKLLPVNPDGSRAVDRHWPMSKTWAAMEALLATGKVKAIGVSNWSIPYLEELEKTWTVVPAVNQVRLTPLRSVFLSDTDAASGLRRSSSIPSTRNTNSRRGATSAAS